MARGSAWHAQRWRSFVVVTLALLARVDAHGGHMDKIPPGKYASDEPIVGSILPCFLEKSWLRSLDRMLFYGRILS